MPVKHLSNCPCCAPRLGRRGFLGLMAGAVAMGARGAFAAAGEYEAMLLNCIDPRVTTGNAAYMRGRNLGDLYSHFVIAGGPIGVVSPRFQSWHAVFWDNLAITIELHRIRRVVAITHRDCGAAALAFGAPAVATPDAETASHGQALREFRAQVAARQPALTVDLGIMALDGSVLAVS